MKKRLTALLFNMEVLVTLAVIFFIIYSIGNKSKKRPVGSPKISGTQPQAKNSTQAKKPTSLPAHASNKVLFSISADSPIEYSYNLKDREDSVIDVTGKGVKISQSSDTSQHSQKIVPYWPHQYVYSYDELNGASDGQKSFYEYFKSCFLKGEYLDLNGNTNYAFILLFDLLNEADSSRKIDEIETHLKTLGKHYPKTNRYGKSFFISKLQKWGDYENAARLMRESWETDTFNVNTYDSSYFQLGSRFKNKLKLSKDDETLLNHLWDPNNNFTSVEFCLLEIIKLYLSVVKSLDQEFKKEGSSIEVAWKELAELIAVKQYRYKPGSSNYAYAVTAAKTEFYQLLFKHTENAVRQYYGHKRKLTIDLNYRPEIKLQLEQKVLSKLPALLSLLIKQVSLPDEKTELELNIQNTTRWKLTFETLTADFISGDSNGFVKSVMKLAERNKHNPSIENIFFEASKFISKWDRAVALQLYIHYIYYDLKSATFDNKPLAKTIQKSLFQSAQQLQDFEGLINTFIQDRNLEKALAAASGFYSPKRKKIKLDTDIIRAVHVKHADTVDLLAELLNDETPVTPEGANQPIETSMGEVAVQIAPAALSNNKTALSNKFGFSVHQMELLEFFSKSSYAVPSTDLEAFARSRALFKNQLVESINESCYEALDDILIEEDDDLFVINESYYKKIITP